MDSLRTEIKDERRNPEVSLIIRIPDRRGFRNEEAVKYNRIIRRERCQGAMANFAPERFTMAG